MTEKESVLITTKDFLEIVCFWLLSDEPITIGNKGSMQGARIVNIPAKKEIPKNIILLNFI